MRRAIVLILLTMSCVVSAQKLDFIGLNGIKFGMKVKELIQPQYIFDTSSAYTDTAFQIQFTRCHMYYSKAQNLKLDGFTASRVEYEFCDSLLSYVFVYVSGKEEIANALAALKVDFPHMGCGRNVPLGSCTLIDTSHRGVRMILRINQATNEMNFVLIPRKGAG